MFFYAVINHVNVTSNTKDALKDPSKASMKQLKKNSFQLNLSKRE